MFSVASPLPQCSSALLHGRNEFDMSASESLLTLDWLVRATRRHRLIREGLGNHWWHLSISGPVLGIKRTRISTKQRKDLTGDIRQHCYPMLKAVYKEHTYIITLYLKYLSILKIINKILFYSN